MTMELSDLFVGDIVAIITNLDRTVSGRVDRLTPTQIQVGENRFWKKNGRRVGDHDIYRSQCIVPMTEALSAEIERDTNIRLVRAALWWNMTNEALSRVVQIVRDESSFKRGLDK